MKLKLFESFGEPIIYPLGQVSNGLLPNSNRDQTMLENFLKKVMLETDVSLSNGMKFEVIKNDFHIDIMKKVKSHFTFPNYKVSSYLRMDKNIDHYWRRYFHLSPIPYSEIYILSEDGSKNLTIYIAKGPFIFLTTYYSTLNQAMHNSIQSYQVSRLIEPWTAWGFFDIEGLDTILDKLAKTISAPTNPFPDSIYV